MVIYKQRITSSLKMGFVVIVVVVQWLRLTTPSAGDPGLIPNQETRSHML